MVVYFRCPRLQNWVVGRVYQRRCVDLCRQTKKNSVCARHVGEMTARDAHGVDLSVEETARGDFLDDYQSHVTGLLNGASGSTRQRVCGVDRVHPASPEALVRS